MARKPENTFIADIHKRMRTEFPEIYPEKTHNPFRGGIPDVYYDSPALDGWIEYKWFNPVPPQINLVDGKQPILSALQQKWLNRARDNGRNVGVLVGFRGRTCKHGVLVRDWYEVVDRAEFIERSIPIDELPATISRFLEVLEHEPQ